MADEVNLAINKKDEVEVRDHILAIKTLCNLVLEGPVKKDSEKMTIPQGNIETKPLKKQVIEDANGESLFDF
jgi:hypothetical protein